MLGAAAPSPAIAFVRARLIPQSVAMLAYASTAQAQSSLQNIYGFGRSYADTNAPGDPGAIFKFILPRECFHPTRRWDFRNC